MSDLRAKIQLARIQDDAWLWSTLVQELLRSDVAEGMKAALSGATRGTPGGHIKQKATALIVEHLPALAQTDVRAATDAAVTAAIYSAPDSETRAKATEFLVAHLEILAGIDSKLAAYNSQFALNWATPGSDVAEEAARVWKNLSVAHPAEAAEAAYRESDVLGEVAPGMDCARRA